MKKLLLFTLAITLGNHPGRDYSGVGGGARGWDDSGDNHRKGGSGGSGSGRGNISS